MSNLLWAASSSRCIIQVDHFKMILKGPDFMPVKTSASDLALRNLIKTIETSPAFLERLSHLSSNDRHWLALDLADDIRWANTSEVDQAYYDGIHQGRRQRQVELEDQLRELKNVLLKHQRQAQPVWIVRVLRRLFAWM